MKKKILITGGAGFIGSYLAEEFKNEYGVVIYDNYHRSSLEFIPELVNSKDVEIVKGDIPSEFLYEDESPGCKKPGQDCCLKNYFSFLNGRHS